MGNLIYDPEGNVIGKLPNKIVSHEYPNYPDNPPPDQPPTNAKNEVIIPRPKPVESLEITGWNAHFIGKRLFEIDKTGQSTKYIAMTGSVVNTDIKLQYNFRLVRIELKHTDTNKADSTDSLSATISRKKYGLWNVLAQNTAIVKADADFLFGETYEFLQTELRLALNTTSTDRIYVVIVIQLLN